MAMTLDQLLNNGGVLRFRKPHGAYVIKNGERWPVPKEEIEAAIKAGKIRPEGSKPDIHGVWHFTRARH